MSKPKTKNEEPNEKNVCDRRNARKKSTANRRSKEYELRSARLPENKKGTRKPQRSGRFRSTSRQIKFRSPGSTLLEYAQGQFPAGFLHDIFPIFLGLNLD